MSHFWTSAMVVSAMNRKRREITMTAAASCAGLHCSRPECRKRRKERMRREWDGRRERRYSWANLWPKVAVVHPLRVNTVIQDDRWRLEVEARAMKYAYPILLTTPTYHMRILGVSP